MRQARAGNGAGAEAGVGKGVQEGRKEIRRDKTINVSRRGY